MQSMGRSLMTTRKPKCIHGKVERDGTRMASLLVHHNQTALLNDPPIVTCDGRRECKLCIGDNSVGIGEMQCMVISQ